MSEERDDIRTRGRAAARSVVRGESGMTLVEIMVVITILGILMTIVGVAALNRLEEAKVDTTMVQIGNIEGALTQFKVNYGKYPTTGEGLEALINPPASKSGRTFESYLDSETVPVDAWGNPFLYTSPGSSRDYEIVSLGADGVEGGEKKNADIKSWEIK
ncbi:MAG: type II secretion system major pseudopilin GspG [Myxococcota bacterium]|jgi:general secretion pathway protein G|nr:type II secretion system major pseudopilin GspG [Myxococcota bacterium]